MRRMRRWSDSVNLFVARRQLRRIRLQGGERLNALEMFDESVSPEVEPVGLYLYLTAVAVAWSNLILPFGLLAGGLAYLGDKIDGNRGNHVGLGIGFLPLGICLVGGADALWRRWFAKAARTQYVAADFVLDERSRRLVRIARVNDAAIVIQVLVGVVLAVAIARG